jgi:hypothetical protein
MRRDGEETVKKFIGWTVAEVLFGIGHVISLMPNGGYHPLYSWFMVTSVTAQEWGGAGPWVKQGEDK